MTGPDSDSDASAVGDLMGRLAERFYLFPRLSVLLCLLIAAAGLSSLVVLPRLEDPVLVSRAGNVTTLLPGADAERVEGLVTEKLETRLLEVASIKRLRSQSRAGSSFISIELRDEVRRPEAAWSEVRGKLQDAIADLPDDALRPVLETPDLAAYAWIGGVFWDRPEPPVEGITRRLALDLRERLRALPGTKQVDVYGDPGEEVIVEIDPLAAAAVGLSATRVASQLAGGDAKRSAGTLHGVERELVVEVRNQFESLEEIRRTPLKAAAATGMVRLDAVAQVQRGVTDPPSERLIRDGRCGVALAVRLRPEDRIDRWFSRADPMLAAFADQLPDGLQLQTLMRQDRYVNERFATLTRNLLLACLAVASVSCLMMGWRSALLVTLTLPLAGMMVLAGMRLLSIPIHQMSITGLIIALGLMIDNAIIVVDELGVALRRGRAPRAAIRQLVGRLTAPLLASTVTTAFAFAPIALMEGPAGEFVSSIAITVMLAIFSSLLLALTIVPALSAALLAVGVPADPDGGRPPTGSWRFWQHGLGWPQLTRLYTTWLDRLLQRPGWGIVLGITLPILGMVVATRLPEQFFPPADRDQLHIELELGPTASLAQTEQLAMAVDERLRRYPRVKHASWQLGGSVPAFYYNVITRRRNTPNYAQGLIELDSSQDGRQLIEQLQNDLDQQFPAARILVRQLEQGPPFAAPIEVRLFGPDLDRLQTLGDELRLIASELPDMLHVRADLSEQRPVASLLVDQDQARWAGLSESQIASELFAHLEGLPAGSILEGVEQLPVRVRMAGGQRREPQALADTELIVTELVGSDSGRTEPARRVPLSALAEQRLRPKRSAILRYDGRRMNEVQGYIAAGVLPSKVLGQLQARLEAEPLELPPGYSIEYGGEASERDQAVGRLMANVSVLATAMAGGLVLALASFRLAAIIGLVAGMSIGLGVGALWVFGYPLGFMAIIGTMGLIGVAINDSIVVVSRLSQDGAIRRGDRRATVDAIVELTRHLLTTTVTTMAGFLPLVLTGGGFWPPLAVAVGGGVFGATLMSVTLVPCIFHRWIAGRWDVAAAA